MEKENTQNEKSKKKKFILFGVGTVATGILGYFGWQWWSDRKQKKDEDKSDASTDTTSFQLPEQKMISQQPPVKTAPQRNDDFPLKKGSKGARVKALQLMFLSKYGKSILPKYGADEDFGSEMSAALKKLNLPDQIDESTYNVLIKGNTIDASKVALSLYNAAISKNIKQVLFTMSGMKSTDDYSAVSNVFKTNYTINGVRQTLVNGLLNSFSDEDQKQQIRLEFLRMGLKYDGSKWALAGLDGIPNGKEIITTEATTVYTAKGKGKFNIPKNIVLGKQEYVLSDWTYFFPLNSDTLFKVQTDDIKMYKK